MFFFIFFFINNIVNVDEMYNRKDSCLSLQKKVFDLWLCDIFFLKITIFFVMTITNKNLTINDRTLLTMKLDELK